jgi:hypothetical protein
MHQPLQGKVSDSSLLQHLVASSPTLSFVLRTLMLPAAADPPIAACCWCCRFHPTGVHLLCGRMCVPADEWGVSPARLLPAAHRRDGVALRLCRHCSLDRGVVRAGHVLRLPVPTLLAQLLSDDNH